MKLYRCIKTFECHKTIDERPVSIIIPFGSVSVFDEDLDPNPKYWEELNIIVAPKEKDTP